jgi:hypothetical protein
MLLPLAWLVAAALPAAAQPAAAPADEGLFCPGCAADPRIRMRPADALPREVVRRRFVKVDRAYLQAQLVAGGGPVRLNLFPDVVVDVARESVQSVGGGGLVWQGRAADGTVTLVIAAERITGTATLRGRTYALLPDHSGNTVIDEIDPAGFPEPGPHPQPPPQEGRPRAVP